MDYMRLFFNLYSEKNIKLKREILEDIIKNIVINRYVTDIDGFNNMARKLRIASQISTPEILNLYYKYAVKYNISNSITQFYEKNNRDLLEKAVLTWQQIRRLFKNKYLKVKVIKHHINKNFRIADEIVVLGIIDIKDIEDASKFCKSKNNEFVVCTMNTELIF